MGDTDMKHIVLMSGLALLAACSKPAPTAEVATAPTASTSEVAAAMNAAPPPGTYQVNMPDGTTRTTTIKADGTYVDIANGKEVEKGKVAGRDGKTCFTPTTGAETCLTNNPPSPDGSWTATDAKGEKYTITPPARH